MATRNLFPFGIDEEEDRGPAGLPGFKQFPDQGGQPPQPPAARTPQVPQPGARLPQPGVKLPGFGGDGTRGKSKRFQQEEQKFEDAAGEMNTDNFVDKEGKFNWMAALAPMIGAGVGALAGGKSGAFLGASAGAGFLKGRIQRAKLDELRKDKKTAFLIKNIDAVKAVDKKAAAKLTVRMYKQLGIETTEEEVLAGYEKEDQEVRSAKIQDQIDQLEKNKNYAQALQVRWDNFATLNQGREPTMGDLDRMNEDFTAKIDKAKLAEDTKRAQLAAANAQLDLSKAKLVTEGVRQEILRDKGKNKTPNFVQTRLGVFRLASIYAGMEESDALTEAYKLMENPATVEQGRKLMKQDAARTGKKFTEEHVRKAYQVMRDGDPEMFLKQDGEFIPVEILTGIGGPDEPEITHTGATTPATTPAATRAKSKSGLSPAAVSPSPPLSTDQEFINEIIFDASERGEVITRAQAKERIEAIEQEEDWRSAMIRGLMEEKGIPRPEAERLFREWKTSYVKK